jgi:hypothetical protein
MKTIPAKIPETGFGKNEAIAINKIIDFMKTLQPLPSADAEIDRTDLGFRVRSKGGDGGDGTGNVPRWG